MEVESVDPCPDLAPTAAAPAAALAASLVSKRELLVSSWLCFPYGELSRREFLRFRKKRMTMEITRRRTTPTGDFELVWNGTEAW